MHNLITSHSKNKAFFSLSTLAMALGVFFAVLPFVSDISSSDQNVTLTVITATADDGSGDGAGGDGGASDGGGGDGAGGDGGASDGGGGDGAGGDGGASDGGGGDLGNDNGPAGDAGAGIPSSPTDNGTGDGAGIPSNPSDSGNGDGAGIPSSPTDNGTGDGAGIPGDACCGDSGDDGSGDGAGIPGDACCGSDGGFVGPTAPTDGGVDGGTDPTPLAYPVCTISASPTRINLGQSATITWTSADATVVTFTGAGTVSASGSRVVTPTVTTVYTLQALSATGMTECNQTIIVDQPTPQSAFCDSFTATPSLRNGAGPVLLSWSTTNATQVTINNGVGSVAVDGSQTVNVTGDTTFTLTATGNGTTDDCQVSVSTSGGGGGSNGPVCDAFTATPNTLSAPGTVTLNWSTTRTTGVSINNGVGSVPEDGSVTVNVSGDTTYTLTASGNGAPQECSVSVDVTTGGGSGGSSGGGGGGGSSSLRCNLVASDNTVSPGQRIVLLWENRRATDMYIKDNRGNVIIDSRKNKSVDVQSDSIIVNPSRTTSYVLTVVRGSRERECAVDVIMDGVTVSKISLTEVPYTGFDAGPVLTTVFYTLIVLWSAALAYLLVAPKGTKRTPVVATENTGTTRYTEPCVPPCLPQIEEKDFRGHVIEMPPTRMDAAVVPSNLPVGEAPALEETTVGYSTYYSGNTEDTLEPSTHEYEMLEDRAHAERVLISSDALRFIIAQGSDAGEQIALLNRVITAAKASYPKEDGWIAVNKEKVVALLSV